MEARAIHFILKVPDNQLNTMQTNPDTYRPYRFRRFKACFTCWNGYGHSKDDKIIKRLDRKKKKHFVKLYDLLKFYVEYNRWDIAHSCTLGSDYKNWKGCLPYIPILKKYQ